MPPGIVADLYTRRWRIEETFNTVKRLLGLSYLWIGSFNGIALQVWATWIVYIVLGDLAVEPIAYFADPHNQSLDVVKALRKKRPRLEFDPFPKGLTSKHFA